MSKPSAFEGRYMLMMAWKMEARELRCRCKPHLIATERHHPRGPMWETGTGLKAHDWFVLPLSKEAHDEYHADAEAWAARYGTHQELLKAFWREFKIVPGDWMVEGMHPRRADWFKRVLDRLGC